MTTAASPLIAPAPSTFQPRLPVDLNNPKVMRDCYRHFDWLLENEPVHRGKMSLMRAWFVSRYDDCETILKDKHRITRNRARAKGKEGKGAYPVPKALRHLVSSLVNADDPEHKRLRDLVHKAFTPRALGHIQQRIDALCGELLDDVMQHDEVDLIESYTQPIPVKVISEMMGVGDEDIDLFVKGASFMSDGFGLNLLKVLAWDLPKLDRLVRKLIADKRKNPGDDILSGLVHAEVDGDRLTEDEVAGLAFVLTFAGYETTVYLIANTVLMLLMHPEQRELALSDDKLLDGAIEETLRFHGSVQGTEIMYALEDISRFEKYGAAERTGEPGGERPGVHVYLPQGAGATLEEDARVKLYMLEPKSLSQILPYFHNLGLEVLDERPFEIETADHRDFFLYDLGLKYPAGVDPERTGALLGESFGAAVSGVVESDSFDRLVLREGMHWRQVIVLRAYAKYMRQMGNTNSFEFMADTLLANPDVARGLNALFAARFDPALPESEREQRQDEVRAGLDKAIEQVATLDADRVLRTFKNLIQATLRTNFYQNKTHVSFKLDPSGIDGLPFPRPMYEIWVYSPRVEGVHLRFGKVARGGLRWSDRREDFRTEILGLVKAQTVKNAVIVPTGAKGGFYAKQLPDPTADRNAWMAEGIESYKTFIRGLLDLTDNLVTTPEGERLVPPADVVRHDGDDSYLVVAADKGTASFSDIANGLSAEYGFWLGDAFASGGSVGYDHKAMGITARGAWESVKRHFSELDLDTQAEPFTVVGVGDMSGDVFGNGMLLSRHIRLLAAFDHRHIFLDPNPDEAASFEERQRLFELPRSSWDDYDKSLISEGGGVFARQAKSIPVSAQVRAALGLPEGTTRLSPPELLRAILLAPADLLYNGGIGTYVKASTETNAEVGDKANDAIRVDGRELRVKVVGEGGNLGMTQRGRIEAALQGVILNTDAIDNSAGVDCSDHEVNIKIFVDRMVAAGKLDPAERAEFLSSMTDEVGRLVLEDNIDQNILLLNDRMRVAEWSPSYERLMDWLEKSADLKRELEALPTTETLRERLEQGQGLTSPELSVLAAYAKIELATALRDSDLAEDPWFRETLRAYFPKQLRERFDAELDTHPLRREIIATVVANDMINLGGITFAFRAMEETSATEAAVAKAFIALREVYELDIMVAELNELPASFPTEHWSTVHLDIRRLLDRAVRWVLSQGNAARPIAEIVAEFKPLMDPMRARLLDYLRGDDRERVSQWLEKARSWELPEDLAHRWAELFESFVLLDIAKIVHASPEPVENIAHVYYTVFNRFHADSLLERITKLPRKDRWQALARAALRDDLYSTVSDMTTAVLEATPSDMPAEERLVVWEGQNVEQLGRAKSMFDEVNSLEADDMASLSVALRLLRSIVRR